MARTYASFVTHYFYKTDISDTARNFEQDGKFFYGFDFYSFSYKQNGTNTAQRQVSSWLTVLCGVGWRGLTTAQQSDAVAIAVVHAGRIVV